MIPPVHKKYSQLCSYEKNYGKILRYMAYKGGNVNEKNLGTPWRQHEFAW